MRTRDEAYDVVWAALNLAQDLDYDVKMCDPKNLKLRFRLFGDKTVLAEAKERQKRLERYRDSAYALQQMVSDWANEYPLIKGEN